MFVKARDAYGLWPRVSVRKRGCLFLWKAYKFIKTKQKNMLGNQKSKTKLRANSSRIALIRLSTLNSLYFSFVSARETY